MTLTLANKVPVNLDAIEDIHVRKALAFNRNGSYRVWGWNVVVYQKGLRRITVAKYGPEEMNQAISLCALIHDMTVFSTQN